MQKFTVAAPILFTCLLPLPLILRAEPPPVQVIFLLSTSHIRVESELSKIRLLYRDLKENLPPSVSLRSFLYLQSGDLSSIELLHLDASAVALNEVDGEAQEIALIKALPGAARLLCRSPSEPPRKVLVIIGRSGKAELPLTLPSHCTITIFAVSTGPKADQALRALAIGSGGTYFQLDKALGHTIAKNVERKIWLPAVRKMHAEQPPEEATGLTLSGYSLLLSLLSGLLCFFLVLSLTGRIRVNTAAATPPSTIAPPKFGPALIVTTDDSTPEVAPLLEAGLRVRSARGNGGIFKFSSGASMTLGAKRAGEAPLADLQVEDPIMSLLHCALFFSTGAFHVADMNTEQGTFVNREHIAGPRRLNPGDLLQIGNTEMEFTLENLLHSPLPTLIETNSSLLLPQAAEEQ